MIYKPAIILLQALLLTVFVCNGDNNSAIKEKQNVSRVKWKHLSSQANQLIRPNVGRQAAALVLDIDKDGMQDFVIAGWNYPSMVWYKKTADGWNKYLIDNRNSHIEAGGAFYDIDGDGALDILQGGSWATNEVWWWENPYPDYQKYKPWERHTIKDSGAKQHHDQIFGDFDGDGLGELVFWNQRAKQLLIADIPENPGVKENWEFIEIWSWPEHFKYEGFANCKKEQPAEKPNILFIAIDDLRPELGCYGNAQIISPNIDKLASEGLVFNRTYCQQPICMASRASLMSGLRPDTLQIYNCLSLEEDAPGILTLDQHFENSGYKIWAAGKIYHHGIDYDVQFGDAYVKVQTEQVGRGYLSEEAIKIVEEYDGWYRENRNEGGGGRGPAFEWPDVPDNAYHDGKMTDMAIEKFTELKLGEKPFFMAVGYKKPHLPFNAPQKYWDMYDANEIEQADNPFMPENVSQYFNYNFGELRNYYGIPKGGTAFSDTLNKTLKHGYYACVSYIDAQIGRLLEGLKENGLDENTIVILWGDHGWKLGEHGMWCKHTQFHLDNHVPMLIKVPGQTPAKTNALVEFVDIYPSLCELAGLELPGHLQGTSFAPLIDNPDREWKEGALSYWPLGRTNPEVLVMGYTVQTELYRYTEWVRESTGELMARDLFDHQTDPDENKNISIDPENEELMSKLSQLLDRGKGWRNMADKIH